MNLLGEKETTDKEVCFTKQGKQNLVKDAYSTLSISVVPAYPFLFQPNKKKD